MWYVDSLSLESAAAEGEAAGVGSVSNADSSSEREELWDQWTTSFL